MCAHVGKGIIIITINNRMTKDKHALTFSLRLKENLILNPLMTSSPFGYP